jgi:nucleoside 2-deoxyribosyltransferase
MKKIYVAIPYTGYAERSFELANQASYEIIKLGHIPFSPISMSHPIVEQSKKDYSFDKQLLGTWDVWSKIDFAFIDWCDELIVIDFNSEAVQNSTGVQAEIEYAQKLGKPVKTIKVEDKINIELLNNLL